MLCINNKRGSFGVKLEEIREYFQEQKNNMEAFDCSKDTCIFDVEVT
jgi:hypothetical protein